MQKDVSLASLTRRRPRLPALPLILNLLFRLGFAGVFLVNGLAAWLEPAPFIALLDHEPARLLTRLVGAEPLLALIAVNDLALGALILAGRWTRFVLAWSGLWLLAVTLLKTFSLV